MCSEEEKKQVEKRIFIWSHHDAGTNCSIHCCLWTSEERFYSFDAEVDMISFNRLCLFQMRTQWEREKRRQTRTRNLNNFYAHRKRYGRPHSIPCHVLRNTFGFVEWRQGFPLRPIAFAHNLCKLVFICILFVRTILNPILSPFCHFECILLHKSHLFMEFGLMWWYLKNCALIQVQYALWVNASIFHVSPRPANPCFFQPISWNTTCANIETIIAHFPCTQCNVFNDDV